jgi:putative ABC transport system permease protein
VIAYAWRDLVRNTRRTLASMAGVALGVGLFSAVLFFVDGSAATMTERALAPLTLDMQRIVTAQPMGLRLTERIDGAPGLDPGQRATVEITLANDGTAPANEVVVRDEPPPPLTYVPGSTSSDGSPVPDVDGDSPLSHGIAGFGMNIGRLGAGASVTITYGVEATAPVSDVQGLPIAATVSSREAQVPIEANAPRVLTLDELLGRLADVPGVAAADGLGVVDLRPGALAAAAAPPPAEPVRVFAFDDAYLDHYPSIRVVDGGLASDGATISVEAARSLGVEPGGTISLTIPGRPRPLTLPVVGVVDLSRAQPLFSSRKASELEEFLYVPDSVVVSPAVFRDEIIPPFEDARATLGTVTKSFPVLEADVLLDRGPLEADPATALSQTTSVARSIDRIAPGQGYLIDNISNALAVASVDAATGRRMFLFLGLPGGALAAFLAAYAASILAATERREHATLRVRGADHRHLRTIVLTKALAIAGIGSLLGVALGIASAAAVLGPDTLFAATPRDLVTSAMLSTGVGLAVTAVALYVPARRAVNREVREQQQAIRSVGTPLWRRAWLDAALLAIAAGVEVVAIRRGALDPPTGSVYQGIAISLPVTLLPAPLLAWLGGLLVSVRSLQRVAPHAPGAPRDRFGHVVRGIASRAIRRRPADLVGGVLGLGLVVAFGTSLTLFAATYDAAKAADARFALGSDLRITPSVLGARPPLASDGAAFLVRNVAAVSPVVFDLENSVLIGPHNQQRENLAAIDPDSLPSVAPLPDQAFVDATATDTIGALAADPRGVLVDEEAADDLSLDVGDRVEIILALGTRRETQEPFTIAGLFERFPGMPEGANLVVDLERYGEATRIRTVDFFLARVQDRSRAGLSSAVRSLERGPGRTTPIHVDSTETFLAKDQSSLTAVNVNGLVGLNTIYALAMSGIAIAIFVFGLMLQRRGEYIALRAQGLRHAELRGLVMVETAVVTLSALIAGLVVGTVMAFLSIGLLRGLFVLGPRMTFPVGGLSTLILVMVAAAVVSGLSATEVLRRVDPAEILREE